MNMINVLLKRLPMMALSFFISWGAHTWMMAVKNEGYNAGDKWSPWLNVQGNGLSAFVIWAAGSAFFMSFVVALIRFGPSRALSSLIAAPRSLLQSFAGGSQRQRGEAMLAAGAALLVSKVLPINSQAMGLLGLVGMYLRVSPRAQQFIRGIAPAFLLVAILPQNMRVLAGIVLAGGGFYLLNSLKTPTTAKNEIAGIFIFAIFSSLITTLLSLFYSTIAWADDGGVAECLDVPGGWWSCDGSDEVIDRGLQAALGGGVGGAVVPLFPPDEKQTKEKPEKKETKPDEKEKTDIPEKIPPQLKRDDISDDCKLLFDRFKEAVATAGRRSEGVLLISKEYQKAVTNYQNNLAKVTIQLGVDAADFAQAGAGGVKSGGAIARGLVQLPDALRELIQKASQRVGSIAAHIAGLMEDIAQIMGRSARAARMAEDAGRLSAQAEGRIAELIGEAAQAEGKIGELEGLLKFSQSADAFTAERNAMAAELTEAEKQLRSGEEQWYKDRMEEETWANREKAQIVNDDAKRFSDAHEELGKVRNEIDSLKSADPGALEASRKEVQTAADEVTKARAKIDEARNVKDLVDNQEYLLERAKADLADFDSQPAMLDYEAKRAAIGKEVEDCKVSFDAAKDRVESAEFEASKRVQREMLQEAYANGADPNDPVGAMESLSAERKEYYRQLQAQLDKELVRAKIDLAGPEKQLRGAYARQSKEWSRLDAQHNELLRQRSDLLAERSKAEIDLQELKDRYTSIDGRPVGFHETNIAELNANYVWKSNLADEARLKYDKLTRETFSNQDLVNKLRARESELNSQLANWKLDVEQELHRLDEARYAEWKKYQGVDADQSPDLAPLREQVSSLREKEAALEKQVNSARDQLPPGTTSESLKAQLSEIRQNMEINKKNLDAARAEAASAKSSLADAENAVKTAEAEKQAAEKALRQAEDEKRQADKELQELQKKEKDIFDKASEYSHDKRKKFDEAVDSVTPEFVKSGTKYVFGKVGEGFHWAFGGQSPEEVARIIKATKEKMEMWSERLKEAERLRASALDDVRNAKLAFDACQAANPK